MIDYLLILHKPITFSRTRIISQVRELWQKLWLNLCYYIFFFPNFPIPVKGEKEKEKRKSLKEWEKTIIIIEEWLFLLLAWQINVDMSSVNFIAFKRMRENHHWSAQPKIKMTMMCIVLKWEVMRLILWEGHSRWSYIKFGIVLINRSHIMNHLHSSL